MKIAVGVDCFVVPPSPKGIHFTARNDMISVRLLLLILRIHECLLIDHGIAEESNSADDPDCIWSLELGCITLGELQRDALSLMSDRDEVLEHFFRLVAITSLCSFVDDGIRLFGYGRRISVSCIESEEECGSDHRIATSESDMLTDLDTILSRASSMDSSGYHPSEYEDDEKYPSTDPCLVEESQSIDTRADADQEDRSCVEFVSFGMVFDYLLWHMEKV